MKAIIIGGGRVGAYLANLLISNNYSVKVIENRENVLNRLKKVLPDESIVFGSGTEPNVLEECGISGADVVAAVTGADETNLVASTIAKFEFGVPRVIARVNNPQNAWLFTPGMGVDVGLNQADLMAHLVLEEIDLKNMLTLLKISHGQYSIVQIKVSEGSGAANRLVRDLDIPGNSVLISIRRGGEVIIPKGDTVINSGDSILAFSDNSSESSLNKLFGSV